MSLVWFDTLRRDPHVNPSFLGACQNVINKIENWDAEMMMSSIKHVICESSRGMLLKGHTMTGKRKKEVEWNKFRKESSRQEHLLLVNPQYLNRIVEFLEPFSSVFNNFALCCTKFNYVCMKHAFQHLNCYDTSWLNPFYFQNGPSDDSFRSGSSQIVLDKIFEEGIKQSVISFDFTKYYFYFIDKKVQRPQDGVYTNVNDRPPGSRDNPNSGTAKVMFRHIFPFPNLAQLLNEAYRFKQCSMTSQFQTVLNNVCAAAVEFPLYFRKATDLKFCTIDSISDEKHVIITGNFWILVGHPSQPGRSLLVHKELAFCSHITRQDASAIRTKGQMKIFTLNDRTTLKNFGEDEMRIDNEEEYSWDDDEPTLTVASIVQKCVPLPVLRSKTLKYSVNNVKDTIKNQLEKLKGMHFLSVEDLYLKMRSKKTYGKSEQKKEQYTQALLKIESLMKPYLLNKLIRKGHDHLKKYIVVEEIEMEDRPAEEMTPKKTGRPRIKLFQRMFTDARFKDTLKHQFRNFAQDVGKHFAEAHSFLSKGIAYIISVIQKKTKHSSSVEVQDGEIVEKSLTYSAGGNCIVISTGLCDRTAKEILIHKEGTGRTLTSIKEEFNLEGKLKQFDKVQKEVRTCRSAIAKSIFIVTKPVKPTDDNSGVTRTKRGRLIFDPNQFGWIRHPIAIAEQDLKQGYQICSFVESHVQHFSQAEKRRVEMNLRFEPFCTCSLKSYIPDMVDRGEEEVVQALRLDIHSKKAIIGDESHTLNMQSKFLLSYLSDLISVDPLSMYTLTPFIFQKKGTKFFENTQYYGMGYSHLIEQFENHEIARDITKHREFLVEMLKEEESLPNKKNPYRSAFTKSAYDLLVASSPDTPIHLFVKFEVVYLEDLAEVLSKFLALIHTFEKRPNRFRDRGFLNLPIQSPGTDIVPFKQFVGKMLQFDILRGVPGTECYDGTIPSLFGAYGDTLESLAKSKDSRSVLLEFLHNFRPKECMTRKFLLDHFIPSVIGGSTHKQPLSTNDRFLEILEDLLSRGLLKKGCFYLHPFLKEVVFESDLAFFDGVINRKFLNEMGTPSSNLNVVLKDYIQKITDTHFKSLSSSIHDELIEHCEKIFNNQKLLYQMEYYELDDFVLIFKNCDYIDCVHDSICAHVLKYFPHYRSAEEAALVVQLVRMGRGRNFDIGKAEQAHCHQKLREYRHTGVSPALKHLYVIDIRTGKRVDASLGMIGKLSQSFVYANFKLKRAAEIEEGPSCAHSENVVHSLPKTVYKSQFQDSWQNLLSTTSQSEDDDDEFIPNNGDDEDSDVEMLDDDDDEEFEQDSDESDDEKQITLELEEGTHRIEQTLEEDGDAIFRDENEVTQTLAPSDVPDVRITRSELHVHPENITQFYQNLPERPKPPNDEYYRSLEQHRSSFNDSLKEWVERKNQLSLAFCESKFLLDFTSPNITIHTLPQSLISFLRPQQLPMSDFGVKMKAKSEPCLNAGLCGVGKTISEALIFILKWLNAVTKVQFIISQTHILEQWLSELQLICGPKYLGVPCPSVLKLWVPTSRPRLDIFQDLLRTQKRILVLCTKESCKHIDTDFANAVGTVNADILIDEAHMLKSSDFESGYVAGIMRLREKAKHIVVCSATPSDGNESQGKTLLSIMKGTIQTDFTFELMREYLKERMTREAPTMTVPCYFIGITLKQPEKMKKVVKLYHKLNKIPEDVDEMSKWISSSQKFHIDCTCHSIDFIANRYEGSKKKKKYKKKWNKFRKILCTEIRRGRFEQFNDLDLSLNPKIQLVLTWGASILNMGESGLIAVSSRKFQDKIRHATQSKSTTFDDYAILKDRILILHGGMTQKKRAEIISKVQNSTVPVIVISTYKIIQAGLNFQGKIIHVLKLSYFDDATIWNQFACRFWRPPDLKRNIPARPVIVFDACFEDSLESIHFLMMTAERLSRMHLVHDGIEISTTQIKNTYKTGNDMTNILQLKEERKHCKIFGILEDRNLAHHIAKAVHLDEVIFGKRTRDINFRE